jgi:hypothetical protein
MKQEISNQIGYNMDEVLHNIILQNDIASLKPEDRVKYIIKMCESLGLNPLTQPIQLIKFQGRVIPYMCKSGTDQLRKIYNVSISNISTSIQDDIIEVNVTASLPSGKTDTDIGCVSVAGLKGDALCNARMKAVTKAKRRVTLAICGCGMLDESEIDTMKGSVHINPYVNENDAKLTNNIFPFEIKSNNITHDENFNKTSATTKTNKTNETEGRVLENDIKLINNCQDLDTLDSLYFDMNKYWIANKKVGGQSLIEGFVTKRKLSLYADEIKADLKSINNTTTMDELKDIFSVLQKKWRLRKLDKVVQKMVDEKESKKAAIEDAFLDQDIDM